MLRDKLTEQLSLFPCHVGGAEIRGPETFGFWRCNSPGTRHDLKAPIQLITHLSVYSTEREKWDSVLSAAPELPEPQHSRPDAGIISAIVLAGTCL